MSWWLGPSGGLYYVDHNRTNGRQTICGAQGHELVNGKAEMTDITDTDKEFWVTDFSGNYVTAPQNLAGFYVYWLSGSNKFRKSKVESITHTPSKTKITLETEVPAAIVTGDRVSLAPVAFRAGFWSVRKNKERGSVPESLVHNIRSHGMTVNARRYSGESNTSPNSNAQFVYQMYDNPRGRPISNEVDISEVPQRTAAPVPHSGHVLLPVVEQLASDLDFELQSLTVSATIDETMATIH